MDRPPSRASLPAIVLLTLFFSSCAAIIESTNTVPPGVIVAITTFKCNCDPLIAESVQDAILDIFFKRTSAKPIKGDTGDIVITGIITTGAGTSRHSDDAFVATARNSSGIALGTGSTTAASGDYVSGITFQAYSKGELVATHTVGQSLGRGAFLSPVHLATQGAIYFSTYLVRKNLIGRH